MSGITNLRDFIIDTSLIIQDDSNNEIINKFYTNSILKRGKSNITFLSSLDNLQIMINNRISSNIPFSIFEFGDKNMKHNDISVRIALQSVGKILLKNHTLSVLELTYHFIKSRFNFLANLNLEVTTEVLESTQFYSIFKSLLITIKLFISNNNDLDISCREPTNTVLRSIVKTVERYCYNYFNLLIIPVPCLTGKDNKGIFINSTLKSDMQILSEFFLWYIIKYDELQLKKQQQQISLIGKKRNIHDMKLLAEASTLTPNQFKNIQTFIPSNMTFVTQYLLAATTSDKQKLLSYGITDLKKKILIIRMAESLQLGIEIKNRIAFNADKQQSMQQQLRSRCEKSKLFISRKTSNSEAYQILDDKNHKIVIGIMQQVARDLHGNSKKRGDTPVDQIILNREDYKEDLISHTGGITSRMTSVVNEYFKREEIAIHLSESTIRRMMFDANITFQKSKNSFTLMRLDQHFCSAQIKMLTLIAQIFSNEIAFISADAKSLIKVETAGSLKGKVIQLMSDMKRVRCHDQGADTLGKICLYVIELIQQDPISWDFQNSEPINGDSFNKRGYININEHIIPGWNQNVHTKKTEGLGVAFAHHHNLHPETGARNASDISEMIYQYLPYFCANNDGKFKSTIFLIVDNSKGASDAQTRFVWILMFLKFDLDSVVIMSYCGGFSKYNPVEKCNGALSTRINKYAIEFEGAENYQYQSNEEINESMEKSMDRVVDICDGTTCSHTGGSIDVKKACHPPNHPGFKFNSAEITAFLECKDKENFKSKEMIDFGTSDEVTSFYNAAWRLLHSTMGEEKVVHRSKHTLCILKNLQNPDLLLPLRGSSQLHDLFMSFGGNIPMPQRSMKLSKQQTNGNDISPRYMDLEEILQLSFVDRLESINNYQLPSKLMTQFLSQRPNFLDQYLIDNKQISIDLMTQLQLLLRASKKDIHLDLASRIAKIKMKNREQQLKDIQRQRGVSTMVEKYFIESPLYNNKFTVPAIKSFLKLYHEPQIKGNKPILIAKAYKVLIENNLIDILPDNNNNNHNAIIEGIALEHAINAQNEFDLLNEEDDFMDEVD